MFRRLRRDFQQVIKEWISPLTDQPLEGEVTQRPLFPLDIYLQTT